MDTHGRRLGQRMAAELRAEMARQGRSRRWLSEQIGESHVTVGRWVKGDTPMSLDSLDAMCRALGLTIADLLAAVERNGGYEMAPLIGQRDPSERSAETGNNSADQYGDTHRYVSVTGWSHSVRGDEDLVTRAA